MIRRFLVLSLLAFGPAVLFGQSADELAQKNIQASGGVAALKSKNSVRVTGVVRTQGLEIPITILRKRPNLTRNELNIQGVQMIDSYDGTNRWRIVPVGGSGQPEKASAGETADMKDQADFDPQFLDYQSKGRKLELVGKEPVEGKEAYKLRMTMESGSVQDIFLDPQTYFVIRQVGEVHTPQGEQPIETILGDQRAVDGVTMPHLIRTRVGATDVEIRVQKIEWNVDLPDSLFTLPAGAK